jgi:drug/metabolite transporter (DMT)-like permease
LTEAAVGLALAAAVLHAFWNLLLAGSRDTQATTVLVLGLSVVAAAPLAAITWDVERAALPYLAASAGLELAYFALLAAAYARAELSVVYPLARGGAPVFVLLGAVLLGAAPSAGQIAGVLLVAVGVVLVRGLRGADRAGTAFGLLIALCIAGYTLVDNGGIEHATPIAYLELVLLPVALAGAVSVGPERLRAAYRPSLLPAALAGFAAYALVLAALKLAPAAPVAAVRETSVVIAVALAGIVLRERVGPGRLAGAALVAAGVAILAV